MKKNNIWLSIIIAVLIVIFHLLVFAIPFIHNGMFWISYGFTLCAFLTAAASLIIAFRTGNDTKSKFFGFPIARVGIVYLVTQLVLCSLFMALSEYMAGWIGVLVYVIVFGLAVIGLAATDTARDHVEKQNIRLQTDTVFMRSAQSKINQMVIQCEDFQSAGQLKKLADELRYSDPVSSMSLKEIEAELSAAIDSLQHAVNNNDNINIFILCKKVGSILSERNRLCKLNKGH